MRRHCAGADRSNPSKLKDNAMQRRLPPELERAILRFTGMFRWFRFNKFMLAMLALFWGGCMFAAYFIGVQGGWLLGSSVGFGLTALVTGFTQIPRLRARFDL